MDGRIEVIELKLSKKDIIKSRIERRNLVKVVIFFDKNVREGTNAITPVISVI